MRFVGVLLCSCHPLHVARFVVAFIAEATDARSLWALAHVGEKIREDEPAFADLDAFAAVLFVRQVFAAQLH